MDQKSNTRKEGDMDWTLILESVIKAVVPIVAAALVTVAFQWIGVQKKKAELALGEQWSWALGEAARIAVTSAEQSGLADLLTDYVGGKKQYAIDVAEKYLVSIGVPIDLDLIADLIEAEVLKQFGKTV